MPKKFKKQKSKVRRILPPHYFFLAVIGMALFYFLSAEWRIILIENPWNYLGILFSFLGIFLAVSGIRQFRKHQTPLHPDKEASLLIKGGVYSLSRNPIYLGMILILLGIALFWGNLVSFFIVPLFTFFIQIQFIKKEETFLEDLFGKRYELYKKKVNRWL